VTKVNGSPRHAAPRSSELRVPAIETRQGRDRLLYSFWLDGKSIPSFAAVSRIGRNDQQRIVGYQRPEVLSHISEIRTYLESENPILPNAVVIAFDPVVRFEPFPRAATDAGNDCGRLGTLVIPLPDGDEARKPAWIVDGQQRLAAIRDARVESFPICVVGFVATGDSEQREQFILVNNTKPLPKGLIYELLPMTESRLPSALEKRRFPTALLDRLNLDPESPLFGRVRTPTMPNGVIKDNSLIKVIENSLSDGVLYRCRSAGDRSEDIDEMLRVLRAFWSAVASVFPDAWKEPPRRSRLLHGAGVVALGFVMDAIAARHRAGPRLAMEQFRGDLESLREVCRWTDGYWDFGPGVQRKWNEIQNTPRDIRVLTNYLIVQYKLRVWNRDDGRRQIDAGSQELRPNDE
jgi:DGQHR domain-containing protein